LQVAPELLIIKNNSVSGNFVVYADVTALGIDRFIQLNKPGNVSNYNNGFKNITATNFGVWGTNDTSTGVYFAYAFSSLTGISAIDQYSATGSDINLTKLGAAARFVLIKRIDATGDWYVYDSVRGIVAGDDPFYLLNSTTAQVTNTDYIDPHASGFTVTSNASSTINVSGGTYLYLAFA